MTRRKIIIIGSNHGSSKAGDIIKSSIAQEKIDAVFVEGLDIKQLISINYFEKYPFLIYSLFIYRLFMLIAGREAKAINKILKEQKIKKEFIDIEAKNIPLYHRWYDDLVFIVLFLFSLFYLVVQWPNLIWLVSLILLPVIIMILIFALRSKKIRDEAFASNTLKLINNKNYKTVILVCGKFHAKEVKNYLSKFKFETILLTKCPKI